MSCVRESSPQPEHVVSPRPLESKRTWNPFRGLRRMFRRNKGPSPEPNEVKSFDDISDPPSLDTSKSRSTSQLLDDPFTRSRNLQSNLKSVSHDSVFNPEQHPGQSDSESAISVPQMVYPQANIQAELLEKIQRRRKKIQNDDDCSDDADDGLPRSPSMHSPIIATGNDLLLSKELITKSSHSTCSDGSLLSMDSSEMDEDSLGAHNSRYSSKISLSDRRPPQSHQESSDGDSSTSVPLSHSAAKHRMAIRPKRNPRSKKPLTATNALPATPEVNEEHSGRSTSPETKRQTTDTTDGTTNISTTTITTATFTTTTTATTTTSSCNDSCTANSMVSNCDLDASVDEISVENVPRRGESFFHRLLTRRSTKKKNKSPSAEEVDVDRFLFDENMGAKPRQREEPPPAGRMQLSYPPDLPPDYQPQSQNYQCGQSVEDIFEADTFVPIKQSFSLGQQLLDDDAASSIGGESSMQKFSSSDSVSSIALDEPVENIIEREMATERCRSYSSSDSEYHVFRPLPVPAPRLSKLHNGCGSGSAGSADVVVRRKKRDDQQPELLKVFARRSLKLGQDGEPELLVLAGGGGGGGGDDDDNDNVVHQQENECNSEVANITTENEAVSVVLQLADEKRHQSDSDVDVNENRTLTDMPRFKRIQQRREEWEKRLSQQQHN